MKKERRIAVLFCISFLLFSCNNPGESAKKLISTEKIGNEKIHFLTEMHNFGTLKTGEKVSFSFVFKNNGTNPAGIKDYETSCGCITVKYDHNKIYPGKESIVEVILDTSGEWGNLLKTVELETTSGEKKILTISAYVENEVFNNLLK